MIKRWKLKYKDKRCKVPEPPRHFSCRLAALSEARKAAVADKSQALVRDGDQRVAGLVSAHPYGSYRATRTGSRACACVAYRRMRQAWIAIASS